MIRGEKGWSTTMKLHVVQTKQPPAAAAWLLVLNQEVNKVKNSAISI
jgi:hypothetical protein